MFQDGLYEYLSQQPTLQTIFGVSRCDGTSGIYPMLAVGQPILPYLTYQRISASGDYVFEGQNPFYETRIRFSCYASSQRNASLLAEALKHVWAAWVPSNFPDGTPVLNVMYEFEADDAESLPKGTLFACHLDYMFQYQDVA